MNTSLTITEVFCSPEHPLNKIVTTAMGELGRNRYKVIEPMTIDTCLSLYVKCKKSFGDNATFQTAYNLSTHEFVLIRTISEHIVMCKPTEAGTMIKNTEAHLKDLIQRISSPSHQTERDDLLMLIELGFKTWGMMGQIKGMKHNITNAIQMFEKWYGEEHLTRDISNDFKGGELYQVINDLKLLIGAEDKLQTYKYTCTSGAIWTSFDHGTVQAYNIDHAVQLAKKELKDDLQNVNKILQQIDYDIEMDINSVDVRVVS